MKRQNNESSFEQFFILSRLLRWTALVIPVSLTVGSLVALFLWLLRQSHSFSLRSSLAAFSAATGRYPHLCPV